ncbi:hypothetical protein BDZ91DRAFT_800415 [Kalaharituber pfeilii]|nr:hypothetical protein BDZ91DRAFT_800415 [Kalaharituber pfeilii]
MPRNKLRSQRAVTKIPINDLVDPVELAEDPLEDEENYLSPPVQIDTPSGKRRGPGRPRSEVILDSEDTVIPDDSISQTSTITTAAEKLAIHILFENPLPTSLETLQVIETIWVQVQEDLQLHAPRCKRAESHLKSILSCNRSHLVYASRTNILHLYNLNLLGEEELAQEVENLLERDRFTCQSSKREACVNLFRAEQITDVIWQNYFLGPRK